MSRKWFFRAEDINRMNRDVASQAEAEAGVNNEKIITPLRMAQGVSAMNPGAVIMIELLVGYDSPGDIDSDALYERTIEVTGSPPVVGTLYLVKGYMQSVPYTMTAWLVMCFNSTHFSGINMLTGASYTFPL